MTRWTSALAVLAFEAAMVLAQAGPLPPAAVDAAVAAAAPGEVITIAAGAYADVTLDLRGRGTAVAPITIRAERDGEVVLTGDSRVRIGGQHQVVAGLLLRGVTRGGTLIEFRDGAGVHATDCRLTASAVLDCLPTDPAAGSKWVGLYGQRNRVDHCYFANKTDLGQVMVVWVGAEPDRHRIDHNHFGARPPLGQNGGETLRIGTSGVSLQASECVVEDNLFTGCNGEIEAISNKSCGNVYRRNTFRGVAAQLTLRHGNGCLVSGNWFFGDGVAGSSGVRVIGEDHWVVGNYFEGLRGDRARSAVAVMCGMVDGPLSGYAPVRRLHLLHNTFVDCRSTIELGTGRSDKVPVPPTDLVVAGNLIRARETPVVTQVASPVGLTWDDNLVEAAELGLAEVVQPLAELGLAQRDGLWRPAVDRPAARGWEPLRFDIDGQPRPEPPSIGCDEVGTSAPLVHRPATPADTGPAWLPAGERRLRP